MGRRKSSGKTVEFRIHLSHDMARRLSVAAAIRGASPSALVELALEPHLEFEMPVLPANARTAARGELPPWHRQGRGVVAPPPIREDERG